MDTDHCAQVIEGLRSADLNIRLESFSKLKLISQSIGPTATCSQLLPYLQQFCDDEACVIIELCNQLYDMIDAMGGPDYIHRSFDLLEILILSEDAEIRNTALDVLIKFLPQMPLGHIPRYVLPVLRHLVCSSWPSGRLSAASLIPHIYPYLPSSLQFELISIFSSLCLDENPSVRRQVVSNMGLLTLVSLRHQATLSALYHLLIIVSKDYQDSVRLHAIDASIALSDALSSYNCSHKVASLLLAFSHDRSWRIRYFIALRFPLILLSLGNNVSITTLTDLAITFSALLHDAEPEVRAAAASVIGRTCHLLGYELTATYILHSLDTLVHDQSDHCRIGFSRDFHWLCLHLGQQEQSSSLSAVSTDNNNNTTTPQQRQQHIENTTALREQLYPVLRTLLLDPRSEVPLNILSRISALSSLMPEQTIVKTISPSIVSLVNHHSWRIRLSMSRIMIPLALELSVTTFTSTLLDICLAQVGDSISNVRIAAINNFSKLCIVYGAPWATKTLIPKLRELTSLNSASRFHLAAAQIICGLASLYELPLFVIHIFPLLAQLLSSKTYSIQFAALRACSALFVRLFNISIPVHVWLNENDEEEVDAVQSMIRINIHNQNNLTALLQRQTMMIDKGVDKIYLPTTIHAAQYMQHIDPYTSRWNWVRFSGTAHNPQIGIGPVVTTGKTRSTFPYGITTSSQDLYPQRVFENSTTTTAATEQAPPSGQQQQPQQQQTTTPLLPLPRRDINKFNHNISQYFSDSSSQRLQDKLDQHIEQLHKQDKLLLDDPSINKMIDVLVQHLIAIKQNAYNPQTTSIHDRRGTGRNSGGQIGISGPYIVTPSVSHTSELYTYAVALLTALGK